ncbi:site-2 protease family protein [Candidatus Falkowbacteria bacterium CG_4_9_14_3_um_filter_36_9]|uniref:Peptidase M50 domain-containing protein n=2 Tax=Candidatus Falkowiibacteriota TaxID=1752728 RepID=A0A1J4T8S7_9BACT|nr:MAG: hypothetical protein AUJ27_00415 [Candidatus Falkowbacteria bacterium CG1_02_37_44]PIV51861.1 MAG: site-2 protease family protein [Candidatus Falkowbacteria bacterium CG02_land_8_20_14_3_00_36_14]PIX12062.1 MAG: site-2 protease family protein [Candidatus Falkowbacteria bacterium CG_4_8_14_3_um_filter_36_11]PJA10834.1 MAG: site-2 protease family protein [Candidatus Falkowbacteria bacterium CG_4_10_14_0_2_um_filter_36_22]PJB20230.1 MAG: site-2 protease family protein [Candidatus Falkowbac
MIITLFIIIVLIISAVFHEYAHGWAASKLGDDTARNAGRLTLNPIPHLDLVGSIILPLFLLIANAGFFLAWAKPVPYNPYNLRDPKYGDLKVALGGPGTNFILAAVFGLIVRFIPLPILLKTDLIINFFTQNYNFLLDNMQGSIMVSIFIMSLIICFINLLLMVFNLIPVPPLDGSKVLMAFLPYNWQIRLHQIEPYGIFIVLFLLYSGLFIFISYILFFLLQVITGIRLLF